MSVTVDFIKCEAIKDILELVLEQAEEAGLYVRIDQVMQDPPAMGNTKPVIIVEPKYRPS